MRKLIIAAMTAGLLAVAAPAFADVGGTSENSNNQVDCNDSTPGATGFSQPISGGTYIGADGAPDASALSGALVICNESGAVPIQGRVIIKGGGANPTGTYIAADGDADNPQTQADGYAKVKVGTDAGAVCGPGDSTSSTGGGPCAP